MTLIIDSSEGEAFQVLALSGGGYKGLYTAKIIHDIEKFTDTGFANHFDLLCGTSIGGVIALALATNEIPASNVVECLKEHGSNIFKQNDLSSLCNPIDSYIYKKYGLTLKQGLFGAKHSNTQLKEVLESLFGDRRMGDLKSRVLIPTANWSKGGPQFFKTQHNERFSQDNDVLLVDVAMATSAAPIYFPNYQLNESVYVDGGIVGNAPGLFGVHEAEVNIEAAKGKHPKLLSMGTLSSKVTADQSKTLDKGALAWGDSLFAFMMACQEGVSDYMLKQKLGKDYYHIDTTPGPDQVNNLKLDLANKAATQTLLALGKQSSQEVLGDELFLRFLEHEAPKPTFFNQ